MNHFARVGADIKTLSSSLQFNNINCNSHHINFSKSSITHATMGAEANTDKPHAHHALPKDIPEDDGLRNHAAPGVSKVFKLREM
jgi:hypothetical protein